MEVKRLQNEAGLAKTLYMQVGEAGQKEAVPKQSGVLVLSSIAFEVKQHAVT
jgi:hypothetical protein